MRNRFAHGSRLDEQTFIRLVRRFAEDHDASRIARELDVNRKTVNDYLFRMRVRLAAHCVVSALKEAGPTSREVYFLAGAPEPALGPGLFSGVVLPDGTLHAEVAPGGDALALKTLLRGRLAVRGWDREPFPDSDGGFAQTLDLDFLEADSIMDPAGRAGMSAGELVAGFLAYARSRLLKFRGVGADRLRLHLKETELRFNLCAPRGPSAQTARTPDATVPERLARLTLDLLEARPLSDRRNRPSHRNSLTRRTSE